MYDGAKEVVPREAGDQIASKSLSPLPPTAMDHSPFLARPTAGAIIPLSPQRLNRQLDLMKPTL